VGGRGARRIPCAFNALRVDGRQGSRELTCNLDRDRDTATGDADDGRLVELESGDGFRQRATGCGAITEEGRDPRDDPHVMIPGYSGRTSVSPMDATNSSSSADAWHRGTWHDSTVCGAEAPIRT
jgi:hypothetical protein